MAARSTLPEAEAEIRMVRDAMYCPEAPRVVYAAWLESKGVYL
jgi:hypothetical protein